MSEHSLEEEIGVTREGKVLKRSWFAPLLMLGVAVIILIASDPESTYYSVWRFFWSDFQTILEYQLKTLTMLALLSLLPGLAGLIYRRAFRRWFLTAFIVLFIINAGFDYTESGSIAKIATSGPAIEESGVEQTYSPDVFQPKLFSFWAYLAIELLLIQLLLIWRLRRHSGENISTGTRITYMVLALILFLLGIYCAYAPFVSETWAYSLLSSLIPRSSMVSDLIVVLLQLFILSIILLAGAYSFLAPVLSAFKQGATAKNIVVCLDGTWNEPGTTDYGFLAETNVFKLFTLLKGIRPRRHYNANQCKLYRDQNEIAKQIAFYYHGVGNKFENSELGQLIGGVLGMGASAIIQRAYLDVARVYRPGDRIFIFGFSRGAAIARVLAGHIGRRGIPKSLWTLRLFGQHWSVWTSSKKIEDVPVEVLGCWDTVGAFGISKNILGIPFQKINLLKNLSVALCVKRAYHMVALDETRDSFVPSLMDLDPTSPKRIVEVWFSGNHANVGGGYATDKLSNVTLDFLLRQISSGYACESEMEPGDESWGLYLSAINKGQAADNDGRDVPVIEPDPLGRLREETGFAYSYAPRQIPMHAIIHDSVFERMKRALPVYAPQSLFSINEEIIRKREDIETEAKKLVKTGSLEDEEFKCILAWGQERLSLTKWSKYLESNRDDKFALNDKLTPAEELSNSFLMHQANNAVRT